MQTDQNPPQQLQTMLENSGNLSFSSKEDDEMSKSALAAFREKEEEIDRMRTELHNKLQVRLGRVQEESRRLSSLREELEAIGGDPMRKEIGQIRKKIDALNKELKPLGEKEYKDALDSFNEKNNEKVQLISKLMEMVGESEKLRLKRLEELSKHVDNTS
ncbi:putative DNA double-strand break repair Rad50 ATPase isoform X2 [Cucumis melo var. makuwa]|uniref:DNA double-strand break repair Rad50 ATPase isoform X2 n=1 Tax=Cucumis melo var. makuwa TaxID=1194695 RepID=A0A5A7SM04_CUCMM|nr:putative DNA double-strand break repair Rad50 ATPase isoform X2 [Cucumis melo var. makuwa]